MKRSRMNAVTGVSRAVRPRRRATHGIEKIPDRAAYDVAHGRFERTLSGLTAASAIVMTLEVYLEHYKASFGNK